MNHVDLAAVAHVGLIFLHVLAFSGAFAAIAFGTYAIFHRHDVDTRMLARASWLATGLLAMLWVTGLAVIWLDTKFDLAQLATKPELLAKLSVVSVLTLNGVLLHAWVLPRFAAPQARPPLAATVAAALGATSAAAWVFAAFVGVGKSAAPWLGYAGFMALFVAVVVLAIGVSLVFVRPHLIGKFVFASGATRKTSRTPLASAAKATVLQFSKPQGPLTAE